jgi:hypothetical protein
MLLGGRDIPPFLWEKGGDGNRLSPLFPEIMRKQVSSWELLRTAGKGWEHNDLAYRANN